MLFHDIHHNSAEQQELESHRIAGQSFDEVLYADDTIIDSRNAESLKKLLHAIKLEGEQYCLKLNQKKCEAMPYYGVDGIEFSGGSIVEAVDEARHLGCMLNDEADPEREIHRRKADTCATWERLFE